MNTPQEYTLPRSGMRPLAFVGTLLAEARGDHDDKRGHHLALYRTAAGRYVVAVEYFSLWVGEGSQHVAATCDTPADVAAFLEAHEPTIAVRGYPLGNAFEEKQRRLLADIEARFAGQVSRLLASVPEAAERVE